MTARVRELPKRDAVEGRIQNAILRELGHEPDLILMVNRVRMPPVVTRGGIVRVEYGLGTGTPDLVGILRREVRHRDSGWPVLTSDSDPRVFAFTVPRLVAQWFCLEVKQPGEVADPHQAKVHELWRSFGAFVAVVTSVDEARAALERARKGKAS